MREFKSCLLTVLFAVFALTALARADTAGLWRFDTIGDASDDPYTGQVLYDDLSGSHLKKVSGGGTTWLTSVLPAVSPDGSLALDLTHGPGFFSVSDADAYSIGKTGQLTVEFWYKPADLSRVGGIVSHGSGNNSWGIRQQGATLTFSATNQSGVTRNVSATLPDGDWAHLAVIVDGAAGGAKLYRNGAEIASATGFTEFAAASAPLHVGNGTVEYGRYLMDDLRISDFALPPASLAANTSLSQTPDPGERPADFGHRWIRSNPFMINAIAYQDDAIPSQYTYIDLNSAYVQNSQITPGVSNFQKALNTGVQAHWLGNTVNRDGLALSDRGRTDIHMARNVPNMTGYLVWDEPSRHEMEAIAGEVADYIRSIDSERLVYANLFPTYATPAQLWGAGNPDPIPPGYGYSQYVDDLVAYVDPDILMYDYYPFNRSSSTNISAYFENLAIIRAKAAQHNRPFFSWIQSFDDTQPGGLRLSTRTELRFNIFTQLAAGAKGIAYFQYGDQVPGTIGLRHPDNSENFLYFQADAVNAEVKKLGETLKRLASTDLRFVPGKTGGIAHSTPLGISTWNAGAGVEPRLIDVSISGDGNGKDGLIGFFNDDDGNAYFMLVNLFHSATDPLGDTPLAFELTFDHQIPSLFRLNRLTGEPERVALNDHTLSVTLPGGSGDLFKFDSGNFAGILPGDADLDGDVDLSDLGTLATHYGTAADSRWSHGDFDLDGDVDLVDLTMLATHYAGGEAQAMADFHSAIPELASGMWVIPSFIALRVRRR